MITSAILPRITATWVPIQREPRTPVLYNGPKPYHTTRKIHKLSDQVMLEIRRLRETHDMKSPEICAVLQSHGVQVAPSAIYPICDYAYRAHLVPQLTDVSYITPATPVV
jgi:hypothetical protein